ncbi:MAG: hypothetical protein PHX33_08335, partial [Candidatus Cloacimonetes bacterium]|nr:hypothetical protein [Candidatus Cloacimonadota bacterium]
FFVMQYRPCVAIPCSFLPLLHCLHQVGGVALATPEFSGVSGFACGKNLDVSSPFSNWYT